MKVVIIRKSGKPIFAAKVEEVDELEYIKIKRDCDKNRSLEEKEKEVEIARIKLELSELRREIRILKGEE